MLAPTIKPRPVKWVIKLISGKAHNAPAYVYGVSQHLVKINQPCQQFLCGENVQSHLKYEANVGYNTPLPGLLITYPKKQPGKIIDRLWEPKIILGEEVDTGVRGMRVERGDTHEGITVRRREATGGELGR